jgi:hypothetical protein
MTHLKSARLYLRGLEATKLRLTHWNGDVRSKPLTKLAPLNNEIMRVKLVIKDLTDALVNRLYKGETR